jgi:tetratricopeptide (TPR) repeat protein
MLVGNIYRIQGEMPQAVAAHRKAIALFAALVQQYPGSPVYHQELALGYHTLGQELQGVGLFESASGAFRQAIEHYEQAVQDPWMTRAHNNYAWLLVTCPQQQFCDPARASALAQHAIDVASCPTASWCSSCWNTLGVARYRLGDWRGAIEALEKSCALNNEGESIDWFFLAMAHWKLGDKDKAHFWYQKAVPGKNSTAEPMSRYHAEAAALLGMTCEPSSSSPTSPRK